MSEENSRSGRSEGNRSAVVVFVELLCSTVVGVLLQQLLEPYLRGASEEQGVQILIFTVIVWMIIHFWPASRNGQFIISAVTMISLLSYAGITIVRNSQTPLLPHPLCLELATAVSGTQVRCPDENGAIMLTTIDVGSVALISGRIAGLQAPTECVDWKIDDVPLENGQGAIGCGFTFPVDRKHITMHVIVEGQPRVFVIDLPD